MVHRRVRYGKTDAQRAESLPRNEGGRGYRGTAPIVIIIDDRKIFKEIPKFHPNAKMLKDADKAILVCGDLSLEKFKGYWILDCSAATENILIAAHAKGLGACWLGIYPREERIVGMKKLLSIPEHVVPLSLISLGFPAERKTSEDRYNSSRIHHNKW